MNEFKKILNTKAKNLMDKAPNDIKDQLDSLLKEIGAAVKTNSDESEKIVKKIKAEMASLRKTKAAKNDDGAEPFILKECGSTHGTFYTLFRASKPDIPLRCIYPKRKADEEQTTMCCSACAGFSMLPNNNVLICIGREISITQGDENDV